MKTIDEIGRSAAAQTRAQATRLAAAAGDAGLRSIRAEAGHRSTTRSSNRNRSLAFGGVAAALVAGTITFVATRPDDKHTIVRTVPLVTEATTAPSTAPTSTTERTGVPTTGAQTTQSKTPATAISAATIARSLKVSYRDPPPELTPIPFATYDNSTSAGAGGDIWVAGSPTGAVALVSRGVPSLVAVAGATTRNVALTISPIYLAAVGPDSVAYVLEQPRGGPTLTIDAIALEGSKAGQVAASANLDINRFAEISSGTIGLGPEGIIDRRDGAQLIGYVDGDGNPINWPGPTARAIRDEATNTISIPGSDISWPLAIDRDPAWQAPYVGIAAPAPTSGGNFVFWTEIGPPSTAGDYPPPTIPVIATLLPDGSAVWQRIPDGWSVVSSDIWGTILARQDGSTVTLARLPEVNPGPAVGETVDAGPIPTIAAITSTTSTDPAGR